MKFSKVAEYFERIEKVPGRLEMTRILAELFEEAEVGEIKEICYMSLGQLGPGYARVEMGLAEKMMVRVLARAYEVEDVQVLRTYKELGDVGLVSEKLKIKNQKSKIKEMSLLEVYARLLLIAKEGGEGSQERKVQGLADLLRDLDALSAKFVVRIPVGKLRLGFSDMTILDGLSWMVSGDKSLHNALEEAYNVAADVGLIAQNIKYQIHSTGSGQVSNIKNTDQKLKINKAKEMLEKTTVKLGTPVVAALCQRLKSFDEIMEKMGEVACEPKYDGTRLQIHFRRENESVKLKTQNSKLKTVGPVAHLKKIDNVEMETNWTVRTFTRNLDENSEMFPELSKIGEQLDAEEVILDCEAVGVDPVTGGWLPFQMMITRKRKYGIDAQVKSVPLKFMVFDILYIKNQKLNIKNMESLASAQDKSAAHLDKSEVRNGDVHHLPMSERRKILEEIVKPGEYLELTPLTVTDDPVVCRTEHQKYLNEGLEGVIIKKWSSSYVPGRKGWNWVKMKEVETAKAGLSDTVDCVVMGYYRGRGKRANFGLGAFLVGVRGDKVSKQEDGNIETQFVTVSKIGTGLTDEQFRDLNKRLEVLQTKEKPGEYLVDKLLYPDVWVNPEIVVEIAADNITKSPSHTAEYALRFPRLVKFRDDKDAGQASTVEEVQKLYELQK